MSNELQTTPEQHYYLSRRQDVNESLLLSTEKFLQKSYNFVAIKELKKDPNFIFLIGGWIAQTSVLMQLKNPIDNFVKQDIVNMLTGYYNSLSFEELVKAFELERFGEYEERTEHFQIFDSSYISKILKKYSQWKIEKKKRFNVGPITKLEDVTADNQKQIMDSAIKRHYQEFLQNKQVSVPCSYVFDELYERQLFAKEIDYKTYFKIAKREVSLEIKSKPAVSKGEFNQIKEVLDNIQNAENNEKVLAHAKKLVLHDFFESIRDSGTDLNDLLI